MATFDFQQAMDNAFNAINRIAGATENAAAMRAASQQRRQEQAAQRQFQAEQASLDRQAALEGRRIAEQGEIARVDASQRSTDARIAAADRRSTEERTAEEKRLKSVANQIAMEQEALDRLTDERTSLSTQVQSEIAGEAARRTQENFKASLSPKQRKALDAFRGDPRRFIEAAPEGDQAALESLFASAQSRAEETLESFVPRAVEKLQVKNREIESKIRTLNDIRSSPRNAGWTDFIETLPENRQAPATTAATAVAPIDIAARAAAQEQAQSSAGTRDLTTPSGAASYLQNFARPQSQAQPIPAAQPAAEAPAFPDPRSLLPQQQAPSTPPSQSPIQERNVPVRNVGATAPSFNPAEFARASFGIDVASITPEDQQGMLQLALADGYTQPQVTAILDRVRNGDMDAIAVVKEYSDRWNARRGATQQSDVDLAALV
jgi:hypothetical protein